VGEHFIAGLPSAADDYDYATGMPVPTVHVAGQSLAFVRRSSRWEPDSTVMQCVWRVDEYPSC
jgi:hypothetical protein